MNRRELLGIGVKSALGAAVLLGTSSLIGREVRRIIETPKSLEPKPTPLISEKLANELILQEVNRLGINVSPREQDLWQKGYSYSAQKLPVNDQTTPEVYRRITTTFELMEQSENPYFKEAITFLKSLRDSDKLNIAIGNPPDTKTAAAAEINLSDNEINWMLRIHSNFVLNDSSAVVLAIGIVHEVEHFKNMIAFQESLPASLSAQERYSRQKEKEKDFEHRLEEEQRGYATQTEAFIYEEGLTAYPATGDYVEAAGMYIKCGNDRYSTCWRDYIKTYIQQLN